MSDSREDVLDQELEITDPHHHLWDHLEPTYLLDDLLRDMADGHRVTESVYVECGWKWDFDQRRPERVPLPEVRTVAALAREARQRGGGAIRGIVAHVDLRNDAETVVRGLEESTAAADGLLVGIRHATAWDASPEVFRHRTRPSPGLLADPDVRRGLAEIARRDLTFDAWVYHPQLAEVAAVAAALPQLRIVVDHLGSPLAVGPYAARPAEVEADWRQGLRVLARYPNVRLKLGGIGMSMMRADAGGRRSSFDLARIWAPRITWCIELFGAQRCMFEGNFPVDSAACNYRELWNAFKLIAAGASDTEKAWLFRNTARTTYDPSVGGESR